VELTRGRSRGHELLSHHDDVVAGAFELHAHS